MKVKGKRTDFLSFLSTLFTVKLTFKTCRRIYATGGTLVPVGVAKLARTTDALPSAVRFFAAADVQFALV